MSFRRNGRDPMTYYQANTDDDALICDDCGATRWETSERYGTNVDARLEEAERTGIRWSWIDRYSSDPSTCSMCGGVAR